MVKLDFLILKSKNFQYELPKDILSKGQKTKGGGGPDAPIG